MHADHGWTLRAAADRFQVSVSTAKRWADRYRELGEACMRDRSCRPRFSPRRTPVRTARRIVALRVNRRWGPDRIGHKLGLHPSTVHRYEWEAPGDMVHVDIKKLSRIRRRRRAQGARPRRGPAEQDR